MDGPGPISYRLAVLVDADALKGFSSGVWRFIWREPVEVPSRVKFGIAPRVFEVLDSLRPVSHTAEEKFA